MKALYLMKKTDHLLYVIGFEEESLPDFSSDSDSDSEYGAEDNYQEICELSDLEQFSNILAEAQRIAIAAGNERLKDYNRPKHYLKNSTRTKQRKKRIGKELEKQGYYSIKTWFLKGRVPDQCEGTAGSNQYVCTFVVALSSQ